MPISWRKIILKNLFPAIYLQPLAKIVELLSLEPEKFSKFQFVSLPTLPLS